MTSNKDRKQTKYGYKKQEQMTHTTEPWQVPGQRDILIAFYKFNY